MAYPVRAVFYSMTPTENEYGELEHSRAVSFTTGSRPITMSFKDKVQGDLSLDGEQTFLYVRKNNHTTSVKVGDELQLPNTSSKDYRVIGIDQKLIDRRELLLIIDAKEVDA